MFHAGANIKNEFGSSWTASEIFASSQDLETRWLVSCDIRSQYLMLKYKLYAQTYLVLNLVALIIRNSNAECVLYTTYRYRIDT